MNTTQLPANSHVDILSTWEVQSQFEVRLEQLYLGPFIYVLLPYIKRYEATKDQVGLSSNNSFVTKRNNEKPCSELAFQGVVPSLSAPPPDTSILNQKKNAKSNNSVAPSVSHETVNGEKKNKDCVLEKCILGFRVVGRLSTNRRAVYDPVFSELGYLDFSAAFSQNSPYVAYFSSTLSFPCSISDLTLLSQLELSLFCVDIGFFFGHITLNLFGSNGILRQGRCLIPFNVYPSLELVPPSLGCGDVFYNTCVKCEHSSRGASNDDFLFHPTLNIFEDETTSSSLFSTNSALSTVSSSSAIESESDSDKSKPSVSHNILHLLYRKSFIKLSRKHDRRRVTQSSRRRSSKKSAEEDTKKIHFSSSGKNRTKDLVFSESSLPDVTAKDTRIQEKLQKQKSFLTQGKREQKKAVSDSVAANTVAASSDKAEHFDHYTSRQTAFPKFVDKAGNKKYYRSLPSEQLVSVPRSELSNSYSCNKSIDTNVLNNNDKLCHKENNSVKDSSSTCNRHFYSDNSFKNSHKSSSFSNVQSIYRKNKRNYNNNNISLVSTINNGNINLSAEEVDFTVLERQSRIVGIDNADSRTVDKKGELKLCRQFVGCLSDNEDCVLVSGPSLVSSWLSSSSNTRTDINNDDSDENNAESDHQCDLSHLNGNSCTRELTNNNKTFSEESVQLENQVEEQFDLEIKRKSCQQSEVQNNKNGQFVLVCPNWNESSVRDEKLHKFLSRLESKSKQPANGGQSYVCCDTVDSLLSDTNVSCATPPFKSEYASSLMNHSENSSETSSVVGISEKEVFIKKKNKKKKNSGFEKKKKFLKGFGYKKGQVSPKLHQGWVHLRTHGSIRRSTFRAINCYKLLDLYDRGALPLCASQSSDDHARSCLQKMCEKHLLIALERFGFFSLSLPAFPVPVLYALQPHRSTVAQRPLFGSSSCQQSNTYSLHSPIPLASSMNTKPIFFGPEGKVAQSDGDNVAGSLIMYRQLYHDDALGWECRSRFVHTVKSIVQKQQMHQVMPSTEFTPADHLGSTQQTISKNALLAASFMQSPQITQATETTNVTTLANEDGLSVNAHLPRKPVIAYIPSLAKEQIPTITYSSKCDLGMKSDVLTAVQIKIDNQLLLPQKNSKFVGHENSSVMNQQNEVIGILASGSNELLLKKEEANDDNKAYSNSKDYQLNTSFKEQKNFEDESTQKNFVSFLAEKKKSRLINSYPASLPLNAPQPPCALLQPPVTKEKTSSSSNSLLKNSPFVSSPLDMFRNSKGLLLPVSSAIYQSEQLAKPLFTDNKQQQQEVCETNANILREMWSRFGLLHPHFVDCTNLSQQQQVYYFQQLLHSPMQKEQRHYFQPDDSAFASELTSFDKSSFELFDNNAFNFEGDISEVKLTTSLQQEKELQAQRPSSKMKVSIDSTTPLEIFKGSIHLDQISQPLTTTNKDEENLGGTGLISCFHSALSETQATLSLVSRPMSIPLTYENKYLLWKNRELLRRRGIGLLKLVTAADLALPSSKLPQALTELVSSWPCPTIEGALELLSPLSQSPHVRQFAINSLNAVSDTKLCRFLPQLIQAIRYDTSGPQSKLLDLLIDRASRSPLIASKLHWGLSCESEDTEEGHLFIRGHQRLMDVLSNSYTTTKCNHGWRVIELQKKLIRQLRYISAQVRERRDRADQKTQRLRALLRAAGKAHHRFIPRQQSPEQTVVVAAPSSSSSLLSSGVASGQNMTTEVSNTGIGSFSASCNLSVSPNNAQSVSSESTKQAQSSSYLQQFIPDELNLLDLEVPIPLPIEPHYLLVGVIPEESFVVRSSQYPIVIACRVLVPKKKKSLSKSTGHENQIIQNDENQRQDCDGSINENESAFDRAINNEHMVFWWGKTKEELLALNSFEEDVKKYLFKAGDDLRQDQLVTQLVGIINDLLIEYGCDYCLTVYHVVSLSRRDGLIEFIDRSGSLSSVRKTYPTLRQYFASYYPSPNTDLGFPSEILDRFIKSCSAFSVITFLLGVGDRHLDNLMVSEDGRLFHVDFGFILGEDPKPFPPPMKLCSEIIETLGGVGSEGYTEFQNRCCQCFRCLRRHSNLLIDILLLMANSGIRSLRTDPFSVISRVQEKFQLDTTEAAAEAYLLDIVGISANALFPAVVDKFHEWTVYWK